MSRVNYNVEETKYLFVFFFFFLMYFLHGQQHSEPKTIRDLQRRSSSLLRKVRQMAQKKEMASDSRWQWFSQGYRVSRKSEPKDKDIFIVQSLSTN